MKRKRKNGRKEGKKEGKKEGRKEDGESRFFACYVRRLIGGARVLGFSHGICYLQRMCS